MADEVKTEDKTAAQDTAIVEDVATDAATTAGKDGKTVLKDAATEDKGVAKAYWPDDWLARVSKGDEKRAKDFGKFQSPEAMADAYVNLRKRMDSGEVRTALPKDAKAEELAAWRKDNGIPDKPEGYKLEGMDIPKEDKAIIDGFLKAAHGAHFSPDQAKVAVQSYYAELGRQEEARAAKDDEERKGALDSLNEEWGASFRRNVNMVDGLLSKFPESVRDLIKSARLPNGTALFNNADAVRGFAALALELNPAMVVVPSPGGDLGKSMVDQYKLIQKTKAEDRAAYNKDEAMQTQERDLIDAMIKQGIMNRDGEFIESRKAA